MRMDSELFFELCVCTWYPQRPEEDVRCPGALVIGNCEPISVPLHPLTKDIWVLGIQLQSSARAVNTQLLNHVLYLRTIDGKQSNEIWMKDQKMGNIFIVKSNPKEKPNYEKEAFENISLGLKR